METVYNFPTDAFKSTAVCSSLHYIIIAQIIRFWLLIKLNYAIKIYTKSILQLHHL